ncbi:hypothetical protein BVY01_03285 [bacterium I07]|nr:hypothetical protein BVY01_03285 [bacterium I07]
MHTVLCHHARGEMQAYVEMAQIRGLTEIGFTDHAPGFNGYDPRHRMTIEEMPFYFRSLDSLMKLFPDIRIRTGIEADVYPGHDAYLQMLRKKFPIEYVIGSVHFIDGVSVFEPLEKLRSAIEISSFIDSYFEKICDGMRSKLFDILAHLDLIKFGLPEYEETIIEKAIGILPMIADSGHILEINSSGLRKSPGETYPSLPVIKEACGLGIPVSIGADAHRPVDVGADFEETADLLIDAGYAQHTAVMNDLKVYLPERG